MCRGRCTAQTYGLVRGKAKTGVTTQHLKAGHIKTGHSLTTETTRPPLKPTSDPSLAIATAPTHQSYTLPLEPSQHTVTNGYEVPGCTCTGCIGNSKARKIGRNACFGDCASDPKCWVAFHTTHTGLCFIYLQPLEILSNSTRAQSCYIKSFALNHGVRISPNVSFKPRFYTLSPALSLVGGPGQHIPGFLFKSCGLKLTPPALPNRLSGCDRSVRNWQPEDLKWLRRDGSQLCLFVTEPSSLDSCFARCAGDPRCFVARFDSDLQHCTRSGPFWAVMPSTTRGTITSELHSKTGSTCWAKEAACGLWLKCDSKATKMAFEGTSKPPPPRPPPNPVHVCIASTHECKQWWMHHLVWACHVLSLM